MPLCASLKKKKINEIVYYPLSDALFSTVWVIGNQLRLENSKENVFKTSSS